MTPLPENPTIVILLNARGTIAEFSTNVAPTHKVQIQVTKNVNEYEQLTKGKPFRSPLLASLANPGPVTG